MLYVTPASDGLEWFSIPRSIPLAMLVYQNMTSVGDEVEISFFRFAFTEADMTISRE